MIDAEKIINALKVFDGQTILYDSLNGEVISFKDVINLIEAQKQAIAKRDELIDLQRENLNTTHTNNMELRIEMESLKHRQETIVTNTVKEILEKAPDETNSDEMFVWWIRERFGVQVE